MDDLQPPQAPEATATNELNEVLGGLPDKQRQIIVRSITAAHAESFSGPLPHPDILAKYEKAMPGAAERIFKITEAEQAHRIEYDNRRLNGELSQSARGQWMGFSLCVFFGLIAFGLGYLGHPTLAGIIGGGTIISLAIVFVLNREPKQKKDSTPDLNE